MDINQLCTLEKHTLLSSFPGNVKKKRKEKNCLWNCWISLQRGQTEAAFCLGARSCRFSVGGGRGGRVHVVVLQVVGRRRLTAFHPLPFHPPVLEPNFHLVERHKLWSAPTLMGFFLSGKDNKKKKWRKYGCVMPWHVGKESHTRKENTKDHPQGAHALTTNKQANLT